MSKRKTMDNADSVKISESWFKDIQNMKYRNYVMNIVKSVIELSASCHNPGSNTSTSAMQTGMNDSNFFVDLTFDQPFVFTLDKIMQFSKEEDIKEFTVEAANNKVTISMIFVDERVKRTKK